ncbi:Protein argonaute-4, partial [Datura stramonium]|nr:Protein argonaute-4 [Datura stramonium]
MASSKDEAKAAITNRVPMARQGIGSKGQKIRLLTNHFKVGMTNSDGHFYHYSVAISYEDGHPVEVKGIGRKIIDKVHQTYSMELAGKDFAYDGEKSLFTIGALPGNKFEFDVVLEDISSSGSTRGENPGENPSDADRKRSKR